MTLTGLDPNDPTPRTARELLFAGGMSTGGGDSRDVLIFGGKTAAGTEDVDTLGEPVADDADAKARFGGRSEWYNMYRKYVAKDPNATISGIAVDDAAGTAAVCTLTVANVPSADATLEISICGIKGYVNVTESEAINDIATDIYVAVNAMDSGMLMCTAAAPGAAVVTITAANKSARSDAVIESIRTRWLTSPGTTTVTKGGIVAGVDVDTNTAAMLQAIQGDQYYWIAPWIDAVPAAADGGLGEAMLNVTNQAKPVNGKEKVLIGGLTGTVAAATGTASDSDMNSPRGYTFQAEDNDWPPCWIAAHLGGVVRSAQIAHPSANITDYSELQLSDPFDKADRPTPTEIRSMLDNGVSPIGFTDNGSPYVVRHITNKSFTIENAVELDDYRAREGHITSAMDFAWSIVKQRWNEQRQDFVADNPKDGQKPTANTTTPGMVEAMIRGIIDDLVSSNPLGRYNGPILAPDKADMMKASVKATKVTGGINVQADFVAVEHLLKFEGKFTDVSGAY
jgi:phage tail sheath gpL-like